MSIFKYILSTLLSLITVINISYSQDNNKKETFKDFYKQRNKEFRDWRAKANADFYDYLKKAWEEFKIQRERIDPLGELPDKPVYYDVEDVEYYNMEYSWDKTFDNLSFPMSFYYSTPIPASAITIDSGEDDNISINFFGIREFIPFSSTMRLSRINAKEYDVAEGWKVLADSQFMPTVEALENLKKKYSFNDWAMYMIIKEITDVCYVDEYINEKVLTQMFLLSQIKYKVRVGSLGDKLIMLIPFSSEIYQVPYISDSDQDFYIYSYSRINNNEPLYTFKNDFPAAESKFNLVIDKQFNLNTDYYQFKAMPKWSAILNEDISVPINIPHIKFSLDYPHSDLSVYYKSSVDSLTASYIFKIIKYKIIKDAMTPEEAVSFVLNLIQNGFDYKTDYEMFGKAKPLFIEESFYYGSNNCKDRVLLFSWIVRDLLGFEVIFLNYPGHIASAVNLGPNIKGDYFIYNGKHYVVCDPTYIGAPIGATMPKYRDANPKIIAFDN